MDLMKWEGKAPRDLWDAFDSLRGEMEDTMNFLRLPDSAGLLDRTQAPAVDLVETDDEIIVKADLPGVQKNDLELTVTDSLLTIKGEKRAEANGEKRKIFRKETWVGSFGRTIELPSLIDTQKVRAELKDGVLTIEIPKKEEAKARLVKVSVN
jgi:HSP20 family protein